MRKDARRDHLLKIHALSVFGAVVLFSIQTLAFKGVLGTGADAGYAALAISDIDSPTMANGGLGRVRVFYGITEWLGAEISGSMVFYAPYDPYVQVETEDASGNSALAWQALPSIRKLRTDTLELALIYTFDIMRLQPFATLGVGSSKTTWESGGIAQRGYDVVLRLNLGLDWLATKYFWAGAAVETGIPLTDDAPFNASTRLLLRATFVFQLL